VAAERSACGKMRKNPHKQCIAYHVSYGYGSNKFKKQIWMIWIATRWSGRVERRSYANDLKWFLSLQKGMDRGYGSPVHAGYGSGPYILSCSHISDCLIHCNILVHLSYFIVIRYDPYTVRLAEYTYTLEQFEIITHSHPSNKCIQYYDKCV
jgi:hypothetical protein